MQVETIFRKIEENSAGESDAHFQQIKKIKKIADRKINSMQLTEFDDIDIVFGMLFSVKELIERNEDEDIQEKLLSIGHRIME